MAIGAKTRKKPLISESSKECHPRLGRRSECLSPGVIEELGKPYGIRGPHLRRWLTRKTKCKSERCLVEKSQLESGRKKKILDTYFRPAMPEKWLNNPDEWLDSNNIAEVMKQYEETYPHFKFYGTNPIDFAAPDPYTEGSLEKKKCLNDDICKLNLKELLKAGKTALGFVYNLDPSNKGGSHWIASFTDIPGHRTYYFDSYGMKAPPQIARFLRSLTLQDPSMKLGYNARRFQYGNSECGMYSLYFLIRMLEGDNFRKFCRRAPSDSEMLEFRKWLFSSRQ